MEAKCTICEFLERAETLARWRYQQARDASRCVLADMEYMNALGAWNQADNALTDHRMLYHEPV